MKVSLSLPGLKIFATAFKTHAAYGIQSKQPNGEHYLLMDFDHDDWRNAAQEVRDNLYERGPYRLITYPTPHGFHCVVLHSFPFRTAALEMLSTPHIDPVHVGFGLRRGYWFLEVPEPFIRLFACSEFLVQPMRIERGGKVNDIWTTKTQPTVDG